MKVLCTTTSGAGHWVPLLPGARGLVDAGHDVLFACPDTAAEAIRGRGFAAPPFDEVHDRTDKQKEMLDRAMATGDQELAERAIAMGFGLISPRAALPRLEQTTADSEPDLLVRDPAEFAGMVLAERLRAAQAPFPVRDRRGKAAVKRSWRPLRQRGRTLATRPTLSAGSPCRT